MLIILPPSIVEKLVALGWGDEINQIPDYDALTTHKLVKIPQLLTERSKLHPVSLREISLTCHMHQVWKNISKPLIEYMEEMKAKRLAREWAHLLAQRKLSAIKLLQAYKVINAPFTAVMPEPRDFYAFDRIKEILDQPTDVNVDVKSFLHLLPELGDMVEHWRGVITATFVQAVKADITRIRHYADELDDDNALGQHENGSQCVKDSDEAIPECVKLACTVYSCIDCEEDQHRLDDMDLPGHLIGSFYKLPLSSQPPQTNPLWFPRVLGHRCLTKPRGFSLIDNDMLEPELAWPLCYRKQWSCELIKVDEDASTVAEAIVKACGMNPKVATPDDMDILDARLECLECLIPGVEDPSHMVFGWRSAVRTIWFVYLTIYC